jgi:Na+/proline symporter
MDQNIVWLALAGLLLAVPVWRVSRSEQQLGYDREQFLLAGRKLTPLRFGLAAASLIWLGPLLLPHLGLVQRAGLSYATLALAVVPLQALGALVTLRSARLARRCHLLTPAELIGSFYQSQPVRRLAALTAVLVALCLAVLCLRLGGDIAEGLLGSAPAIGGVSLPRLVSTAAIALLMLLPTTVGGMGATLRLAAGAAWLTILALVGTLWLAIAAAGDSGHLVEWLRALTSEPAAAPLFTSGRLLDPLPAAAPANMAWPGAMVLSSLIAVLGLAVAPAALTAGFSAAQPATPPSAALASTLAAGLLLLLAAPVVGLLPNVLATAASGGAAAAQPIASPGDEVALLMATLTQPPWGVPGIAALVLTLLLPAAVGAGAAALLTAGAALSHDLGARHTARALRAPLRQRVRVNTTALGAGALLIALAGPADALPLFLLAGAYALQLLPALVGLCFAPRLAARAIEPGLVAGLAAVTLTSEPAANLAAQFGLPLPFAAWPLGLHPAAWGLAANLLLIVLSSRAPAPAADAEAAARTYRRSYSQLGGHLPPDASKSRRLAYLLAALFVAVLLAPLTGLAPTAPTGALLPPLLVWQALALLVGLPLVHLVAHRLQPAGDDGACPATRPRLRLKARSRRQMPAAAATTDEKDETA